MSKSIQVPDPIAMRPEVMHNKNLCKRYGDMVTCYDPERNAGGVIDVSEANPQWWLFVPCTPEQFADKTSKIIAGREGLKAKFSEVSDSKPIWN